MKHLHSIDDHLAFDRDVLALMWEKFRRFPHEMEMTRKTYTSLMVREILISNCAKDAILHPLFTQIENDADIVLKLRQRTSELKKDIKEIMLVGAKEQEFDKKMTSIVETALELCDEDLRKWVPALKGVMAEAEYKLLAGKYEKEKVAALKYEPLVADFPMAFDERIVKDHMLVKKLFEDFKKASTPESQHRIAAEIIRNISIHSFSEELTIYPLFEKKFQNGQVIADASRREHMAVKQDTSKAELMKSGDAGFVEMMMHVEKDFFDHGEHEETREIPTLLALLTRDEAIKLGEKFEKNKEFAPTHPHPSAPDKGGITQKLAGLATVPIDLARDVMMRE